MITLNNATTSIEYEPSTTLEGVPARQVSFTVTGAAVYYSIKIKTEPQVPSSGWEWSEDIFCPPSFAVLQRNCVGIRFRSANEEEPAQVTAQLLTALDMGLA